MMIPKNKPPTLNAKLNKWSKTFHDFLAHCLVKNPTDRPRCMAALLHPFVADFDRTIVKKELTNELRSYVGGETKARGADWRATDVRQESVKMSDAAVRTMVLEKGRGNVPVSKEAGYGRTVRVSDNLAKLGELDEAAIVYHLNARSVSPIYCAVLLHRHLLHRTTRCSHA
jgi:serine/threonine protein kinase